ncbi:MAG: hypothetical protein Q6K80_03905 [Thermostichus sp. DG_1_6_bins_120]
MARSLRLLSHSFSHQKATQWKPRPLPPLPEVASHPEKLGEPDSRTEVQDLPLKAVEPGKGSYGQLELWLISVTLGVSLAIGLCVAFVYSFTVAANYMLGAVVGVVYLRMLSRAVAELGKSRNRLGVGRLALFVGLIVLATRLEALQVLPIFFGFMTYKVTLLIHTVQALTRSSSST